MRRIEHVVFLILLLSVASSSGAEQFIQFGAASIDITPLDSIRMNGYSARTGPSTGVLNPLLARALAIRDCNDRAALILTLDLVTIDRWLADKIAVYVRDQYQIPRERLLISASHTHAGPVVHGTILEMGPLDSFEVRIIEDYTMRLERDILTVIDRAFLELNPGVVKFGLGETELSMNRRVFGPQGVGFGFNPEGPVDGEVPVLAVCDSTGIVRAVIFGYACHAVTLGTARTISSDYPGYAREYIEAAQEGAMAFFVQGCCGDVNPYPRGNATWARTHGLNLAGSVARVLARRMKPVSPQLECAFKTIRLQVEHVPTIEELKTLIESDSVTDGRQRQEIHYARKLRSMLAQGDSIASRYPYPVQVWRFGDDLTWVALGGEVTVDYSLRLKRELQDKAWISAYANDVRGYVGSTRILLEGGYEADHSTTYYQLPSRWILGVEEQIVATVHELIAEIQER